MWTEENAKGNDAEKWKDLSFMKQWCDAIKWNIPRINRGFGN